MPTLPPEVWAQITTYLYSDDILTLRVCSRRLCGILSSDFVWAPIVRRRWYYQRFEVDQGQKMATDDHFREFRRLNSKDKKLRQLLKTIIASNGHVLSPSSKQNLFSQIECSLKSPQEIVPQLLRSRKHYSGPVIWNDKLANLEDRMTNMREIYAASMLLEAVQFHQWFQFMQSNFHQSQRSLHSLLCNFCLIDPNFYELLPLKEKMMDQIMQTCTRYFEDIHQDVTLSWKVARIARIVEQVLTTGHVTDSSPSRFEDFLCLRNCCRCGPCFDLNLYSVVEEICQRLGIDVGVSHRGLVVDHNLIAFTPKGVEIRPSTVRAETPLEAFKYYLYFLFGASMDRCIFPSTGIHHASHAFTKGNPYTGQTTAAGFVEPSSQKIAQMYLRCVQESKLGYWTDLMEYVSDLRTPVFLLMMRSLIFPSRQIAPMIDRLLTETNRLNLDQDVHFRLGSDYDAKFWTSYNRGDFDIGDVVMSEKESLCVVLAFFPLQATTVGASPVPSCYVLTKDHYVMICMTAELYKVEEKIRRFELLEFAEYDQLGAHFTSFDWKYQRFI